MIASAPGKVFVLGEYGVVDGGPALVATVTRRLRARVRACSGTGQLALHVAGTTVRRALTTERVDEIPAEARFVAAAALVAARLFGLAGTDLEISTESELDSGDAKTGLGGSAAVTAATVSAVHRVARAGPSHPRDEHTTVAAAVFAHRLAQRGGSAGDVIASCAGGLVWLDGLDGGDVPDTVAAAAARAAGATLHWQRVALPSALVLDVVASGRSCATGPRVARYRAAAAGTSGPVVRVWATGMRAACEALRDACRADDAAAALRAMRMGARLLSRLGGIASVPVYTPELRRACAVARGLPFTAVKPSGAGGGDCAIALTAAGARATLRDRWRRGGLVPLEVELEPRGAACEVLT